MNIDLSGPVLARLKQEKSSPSFVIETALLEYFSQIDGELSSADLRSQLRIFFNINEKPTIGKIFNLKNILTRCGFDYSIDNYTHLKTLLTEYGFKQYRSNGKSGYKLIERVAPKPARIEAPLSEREQRIESSITLFYSMAKTKHKPIVNMSEIIKTCNLPDTRETRVYVKNVLRYHHVKEVNHSGKKGYKIEKLY